MKHLLLLFALSMGMSHCKSDSKQDSVPPNMPEVPEATGAATGSVLPNQAPLAVAKEIPKDVEMVSGIVTINGGHAGMLSPEKQNMFELRDRTGMLDTSYAHAVQPCYYPFEPVVAYLTGKFSGPAGNPQGVFDVYRIDKMEPKNAVNLQAIGSIFEFWCQGTSPDWDVEMSRMETGVFYQNYTDGTAWMGRWQVPKIVGDTWTYDVKGIDECPGHMIIKVTKEKVIAGGKEYAYSASFTFNGKTKLKGVAIPGMPEEMLRKFHE